MSRDRLTREAGGVRETAAPVFFVERSLGRYKVAQALRDTGESVEVHDDHLPADAPDEEWIKLVASNGWLAITKDKNIRYRQGENDAINRYGAKVIRNTGQKPCR